MEKYIVNCPQCSQSLEVQDEWANMQTQCPTCNANFIIPPREIKPQPPVSPTPVQQNPTPAAENGLKKQSETDTPYNNPAYGVLHSAGTLCFIGFIILFIIGRILEKDWIMAVSFLLFALPAAILSWIAKMIEPGIRFRLLPGERIIGSCHAKADKTFFSDSALPLFIRMTNFRIVFSQITYGVYFRGMGYCFEKILRPKAIISELWHQEVLSVDLDKGDTVLQTTGGKIHLAGRYDKIFRWFGKKAEGSALGCFCVRHKTSIIILGIVFFIFAVLAILCR